jgi:hypothetical protein
MSCRASRHLARDMVRIVYVCQNLGFAYGSPGGVWILESKAIGFFSDSQTLSFLSFFQIHIDGFC